MKKVLYFILFTFCSVSLFSQAIYFEHLRVEHGLSQASALSIYQDEFATIWIATRDGLNRYNGKDIEILKPIPGDSTSLPSNSVRYVCGDKQGHLFVQSKSIVSLYDLKKQKFEVIKKGGAHNLFYCKNNLWICTSDSIFAYNVANKECNLFYSFNKQVDIQMNTILETSTGELYIGTQGKGIYRIKDNTAELIVADAHVTSFYEDIYNNVWVTTRWSGVYVIKDKKVITHYRHNSNNQTSISSDYVRAVCLDNLGYYWIATLNGLDRLNFNTGEFQHYNYSKDDEHSLSNSSIWSIMKDQHGTIWIGSYFGGVDYFNPKYEFFSVYTADKSVPDKLSFPVISCLTEDNKGNLWIGTEGGGLNYLDRKTKKFKSFKHNSDKNSISDNIIKSLIYDPKSELLWIGTHMGGLNSLNTKTKTFKTYLYNPNTYGANMEDGIRRILNYSDTIIVGTARGIKLFNKKNETFSLLIAGENDTEKINQRNIMDMILDKDNCLWFASGTNLYKYHLKKKQLYKVIDNNTLSNSISVIHQNSSGEIWLGTAGSGICQFNPNNNSIRFFNTNNSNLLNDYINDIKESTPGVILVSTNIGLSRFDTKQHLFRNFNSNNGFPITVTNENSLYKTKDGEIFLGGTTGMVSFHDTDLLIERKPVHINFVGLRINGEKVYPGDQHNILDKSIYYTDKIVLNHQHSVITIDYATTGYIKSQKPNIQYKLEGFDNKWTTADLSQSITYTNLNPGTYKLITRIDPEWIGEEKLPAKSLSIIVNPPFYKTKIAYLLYILSASVLILTLFNFHVSKMKLKTSLEYEKREKLQIEELNQFKLRFFTNVSHEFRTPLTIINSQIDMILQMNNIKPTIYNKLLSILRNTERMNKLIAELIDYRKQEQGYLQIKATKQDLIPFLNEIYTSFQDLAIIRGIDFTFSHTTDELIMWFDVVQLEKVFYNLLSNAFKYTPNEGKIDFSVHAENESVTIKVTDNGSGIYSSDLNRIFDRFYQGNNTVNNSTKNIGSGIGLALCKNIIDAHKGNIFVNSKDSEGSEFSVRLLLGENHFNAEEKDYASVSLSANTNPVNKLLLDKEIIQAPKTTQKDLSLNLPVMLIIEDEDDIRMLLEEILSPFFSLRIASDGKSGFEKTKEIQPDIVLSDIMLPHMSGIEVCHQIKTNLETCHIPVVLLTAQTGVEFTIKGLKTGADDYMTKPFNTKVLISRCNNLVNNRRMLQKKYANDLDLSPSIIATNAMEQKFLEKVHQVIEANLDNTQFDSTDFAQQMAVGRSILFTKIKGMTGQTPNELITNIRLKKAIALLKDRPDLSISEISYKVGFSSPSYFIKRFHDFYNQTPAGFRKQSVQTNKNNPKTGA